MSGLTGGIFGLRELSTSDPGRTSFVTSGTNRLKLSLGTVRDHGATAVFGSFWGKNAN